MATFVLVHGAWHGAWCWRRVARLLAANNHEVFTPTLTGVAERSHLLKPDIDLDMQILDVVNEMQWRQLTDVVLIGHSYGGMVVSGVAEKMEKAIASFVMLDAFFPRMGNALEICSRCPCGTLTSQPSAVALLSCRRDRQPCSMSMRRIALGSMRSARRIRSNASCRSWS